VNQPGNVKFRIKFKSGSADNKKFNIDNITLCPYFAPQEIEVFGSNVSILNGATTTKLANDTNFSNNYFVGDAPIVKTFTITNYGSGVLNLSGLSILGSTDFAISALSSSSLSAGASATFDVSFSSISAGLKTAEIRIDNDDTDENPFVFKVSCFSKNYKKCTMQASNVVAFQDFEGTGTLVYVGSGTVAGGQNYGDNRTAKTDMFIGTKSYQVSSTTNTVEFNTLDTSSFENIKLSFRLGAYAATVGNGMEDLDKIQVYVSEDGGLTWSEQLTLRGNTNAVSDINSSTGTPVSVTYNNNLIGGVLYTMSSGSTNTYANSFTINNLPAVSQLKIKMVIVNDNVSEIWSLDDVVIEAKSPESTTWDGLSWSSGVPTANVKAIIDGDYSTTLGEIQACECQINANKTLTVVANDYIEIQNSIINNGALLIEDDGSLIQINDYAVNSGVGVNSLIRTAENLKIFDYIYWSSPQNGTPFSTIPNSRYYEWVADYENPEGYGYGNWFTPSGTTMVNGKGYIFRVPNGNPTQTITFSGNQFNTGVITSQMKKGPYTSTSVIPAGVNGPITNTDDNWNLLGNPYPSAIDAIEFATDNSTVLENAEVMLWRHLTSISSSTSSPYYQSFNSNYSSNDYVTYTASGSVPAGAFDGKIASGQAFFVKMKDDTAVPNTANIAFNNSQRSRVHNNSQFFRTANSKKNADLEKHRIWLDLVSPNKTATSQMIGYIEGATNGDDFLYEAKSSLVSGFQFYSIIDNKNFKIQGRQLPFDQNDVVPLGVIVPTDGKYTVAINTTDGRFKDVNTKIYLEDKVTGDIHDLTVSPYQFDIVKGNYSNRFALRFTNQRLSNTENELNVNSVSVYVKNDNVILKSDIQIIKSYEVYNVLGQLISKETNINALQTAVGNLAKSNQALIVKVTLERGSILSKKILF
jgi:hypothetical protein